MHPFAGTWYIMPTAFGPDGTLDLVSQRAMTEAVLDWGADGITVLGVMGEASALDTSEREAVVRAVVGAARGAPVAVGASASSAHSAAANVRQAASCGAIAAMVSAPTLVRNADALPHFFGQLAAQAEIPLIVQDEPAATGVLIPASILADCLRAARSATVKLEDPPTPEKISAMLRLAPDLAVFGGLGGLASYFELRRGAVGTMTGFSYPEVLRAMRVQLTGGDDAGAYQTYARYLPLIAFEAQQSVGLSIRKELLRQRGVLECPVVRIGGSPSAQLRAELEQVLAAVHIQPSAKPLEL
jgi:4-hydroxy-tetrahydrodipicolinate synthase